MLGRFDARFSGVRYEPGTDMQEEYDPSDEAVHGPIAACFNDYVRRELKFESDIPYELETDVSPWNFGDAANGFPGTVEDLRKAMTRNPYLKIWVTCSYYDLATPFFAAQYEEKHLPIPQSLAKNIEYDWYESGHMVYVRDESLKQLHDRVAAFINSTLAKSK